MTICKFFCWTHPGEKCRHTSKPHVLQVHVRTQKTRWCPANFRGTECRCRLNIFQTISNNHRDLIDILKSDRDLPFPHHFPPHFPTHFHPFPGCSRMMPRIRWRWPSLCPSVSSTTSRTCPAWHISPSTCCCRGLGPAMPCRPSGGFTVESARVTWRFNASHIEDM